MGTFIESGHSKNAANFDHLISAVTTYSTAYAPPRTELGLTSLGTMNTSAQTILTSVKDKYTDWKNATNNREIAFKLLRAMVTRLYNTLAACAVTEQTLDDFKSLNRKLQGNGKKKGKEGTPATDENNNETDAANKVVTPQEDTPKKVSTSQRSFDNQIEHFDKIIKLLGSITAYAPTEADLKVSALNTLITSLRALNTGAVNAYSKLTASRIARNHFFYDQPTGLVSIAKSVKSYVKGHYGADSLEYKQISKLRFVRIKNKK